MAQRTTVQYVDDLDGKEIAEGSGGQVSFAFDGKSYVIDLSDANKAKLEKALSPFIEKASIQRGSSGRKAAKSTRNESATEIREWAKQNGFDVSERGRISSQVMDAWNAR